VLFSKISGKAKVYKNNFKICELIRPKRADKFLIFNYRCDRNVILSF